jgi:hypothetical protein
MSLIISTRLLFYRSNDNWQRGREISFQKYDKPYQAEPLLMETTTIGSEIKDPNQKFIYIYDFTKNWMFHVELINVSKEESTKLAYPVLQEQKGSVRSNTEQKVCSAISLLI